MTAGRGYDKLIAMGKHVLFTTWLGGGNVNPVLGLTEALLADGHEVSALATSFLAERLTDAGISVLAPPAGYLPEGGDTASAIDSADPDLVVVDFMLTSALGAAAASGTPAVGLIHTLYGATMVDGAPHPMLMTGGLEPVNADRAALSLEPIGSLGDLLAAMDGLVVTAPSELDDLAVAVPAPADYLGPLFESADPDADWRPPQGSGPLIVISGGTAAMDAGDEAAMLSAVLTAVAPLEARVLLTLPAYQDAGAFDIPANTTVSGYVRHSAVLPHADLVVTHGGLGTVTAALAHGVPMVCLPLDREQPDNATAVERIGAGARLAPTSAPEAIRDAIETQLMRGGTVSFPADPARAAATLLSHSR